MIALVLLASLANCGRLTELLAAPRVHYQEVPASEYRALTLKYYYNIDGNIPAVQFTAFARIIMKVAAGDGVFSELERQAFVALFMSAYTPEEYLAEYLQIDGSTVDLDTEVSTLKGNTQIALRHIIFATVAISSADGFHDAERQLVDEAAVALGVDAEVVDEIVAGTLQENAGRQRRLKVIGNIAY
jgi:uncharacterized tellurite resistance protein B-like protein